ncbi:MAG: hypothetical protein GEV03_24785 [Streptosporangiales bacterium]|nr:hypothetical protein [Streptosporangiales bacterium]
MPSYRGVAASPKAGRLLRLGLPRDPQAVPHLLALVVSTVATVLITRGLLAATGYPQVGGGGLHVAHVLWGGLLMLVALVALLSFAGPVARPGAAVLGGVGFGLFIDEIGKFVTSDNDYFYRPAAAIMYVVIVLLVLGVHWLHGRRPHHPTEHLAGAVDQAVSGVVGGFTPERRAQARAQLSRAAGAPGAPETAALLRVIPDDTAELFDPTHRVRQLVRMIADRFLAARATAWFAVAVLLLASIFVGLQYLVGLLLAVLPWTPGPMVTVPRLLTALSACVAAGMAGAGAWRLRRDRRYAFTWFQRATLLNLLLTRVFDYAANEFDAVGATVVDLLLLAVITAELARLRRAEHSPQGG